MLHRNKPHTVFVVVAAYNEPATIGDVVSELMACGYSVVVVDDGSVLPLCLAKTADDIFVLRHIFNLGQGAALQTGIEFALQKNAEFIVTFDADGQHTASDIETLLDALSVAGADVVLGSRFLPTASHNMSPTRKALLHVARYVNYIFTRLLLSDAHNGLRAFTKKSASQIQLRENRMAHATEIVRQIKMKKLSLVEAPVHIRYTDYSKAKGQRFGDGFRILYDLLLNKIFK